VRVNQRHTTELAEGYGAVSLPYALARTSPPARAPSAAITWMKGVCRKQDVPRRAWPGSPNMSPAIPCDTLRHNAPPHGELKPLAVLRPIVRSRSQIFSLMYCIVFICSISSSQLYSI
jgi:hypothetical protein